MARRRGFGVLGVRREELLRGYPGHTKAQKRRAKRHLKRQLARGGYFDSHRPVVQKPYVPKADLTDRGWNLVLGRRRKGQGRLIPIGDDGGMFARLLRRFNPRVDA
jgi:hypothetical protein